MILKEIRLKERNRRQITDYYVKAQQRGNGFCECLTKIFRPKEETLQKKTIKGTYQAKKFHDDNQLLLQDAEKHKINKFVLPDFDSINHIKAIDTEALSLIFTNFDAGLKKAKEDHESSRRPVFTSRVASKNVSDRSQVTEKSFLTETSVITEKGGLLAGHNHASSEVGNLDEIIDSFVFGDDGKEISSAKLLVPAQGQVPGL